MIRHRLAFRKKSGNNFWDIKHFPNSILHRKLPEKVASSRPETALKAYVPRII